MRAGLLQAGPLAAAGVVANGAGVVLTIALARLLTPHSYGVLNQLTGLYLILSMPGSAVVVAVVRRVTIWHEDGSGHLVRRWAGRVHRQVTLVVLLWAVIVFSSRHEVAVLLNQQSGIGIAAILTAAAFFVLLSLDRGLLQAHRAYRPLAANLLVEIGVRLVAVIVLVLAGFGPSGAAVGVLIGEVVAAAHARWAAVRAWSGGGARASAGRRELGGGSTARPGARGQDLGASHGGARSRRGVRLPLHGGGAAEHRRAGGRPRQPVAQRRLRRGVGHEQGDRLRRRRPRRVPAPRGRHPLAPGRPRAPPAGRGPGAAGRSVRVAPRRRPDRTREAPAGGLPPRLHVGRRRAGPAGAGDDHAERLGGPHHVPARRGAALGGRRAGRWRRGADRCRSGGARVTAGHRAGGRRPSKRWSCS